MKEEIEEMYSDKFYFRSTSQSPSHRRPSRKRRAPNPKVKALTREAPVRVGELADGLRKAGDVAELKRALAESRAKD